PAALESRAHGALAPASRVPAARDPGSFGARTENHDRRGAADQPVPHRSGEDRAQLNRPATQPGWHLGRLSGITWQAGPEPDHPSRPESHMHRRSSALLVIGMSAVAASCSNLTGGPGAGGTPIGIVLMNARTKGAGYTTYPRVTFYSVGSATFSYSTITSDSCVTTAYDSTATGATTATQIGGGAFVLASVSGLTD